MGISAAVTDAIARAVAIGGLVAIALIHMLELPAALAAIGYLGALFIVAVVASLALGPPSPARATTAPGPRSEGSPR